MNMALDEIGEIGEGGSWEKAIFGAARFPNFGCVRGTKNSFLDFLAGNSPVQPLPHPEPHQRMARPHHGPDPAHAPQSQHVCPSHLPGDHPCLPSICGPAIIKMINNVFKRNKNYYLLLMNINQACFCMLNKLVPDWYKVSNNTNLTAWNASMSIRHILDQLMSIYGMPDVMVLFNNDRGSGPKKQFFCYAPRLNLSMQIHSYMFEECVPIIF
jgi:hypothetical protein